MNLSNRKALIRYTIYFSVFALGLITLSFFYLDTQIALFFSRKDLEKIYYYSREITNIGYSAHYFVIALIGIVFSKFIYSRNKYFQQKISQQKNHNIYQWSIFAIKTLLILGIPLNIIKAVVGRQRPHASVDFYNLNFDMFSFHSHWHSFPSGHSQVMFTVATLALLIWPNQKLVFITLALIFAWTRISIHQHFLSDVLAGAFIGHVGTLWIYYFWPPRLRTEQKTSVHGEFTASR